VDSSDTLFRRIAGVSALVAVLVGGLSGVLFLAAGEFRLDSLLDPVRLLGVGSLGAQLLRWGALTDMLGYYLLLVPLVVCIGRELRPRCGPIVDLFTVSGVLYAAIGATAAVVLAEAGPVLLRAYDQAHPAGRGGIALASRCSPMRCTRVPGRPWRCSRWRSGRLGRACCFGASGACSAASGSRWHSGAGLCRGPDDPGRSRNRPSHWICSARGDAVRGLHGLARSAAASPDTAVTSR
jgi:hypothetical protein